MNVIHTDVGDFQTFQGGKPQYSYRTWQAASSSATETSVKFRNV